MASLFIAFLGVVIIIFIGRKCWDTQKGKTTKCGMVILDILGIMLFIMSLILTGGINISR